MSRKLLILFSVVTVIVCGTTLAVTPALWRQMTDIVHVNTLAHRIADFSLPAGYQTDYAVEVLGYTIAAYKTTSGHGHLAFMQAPPGIIPSGEMIEGYVPNQDRQTTTWRESRLLYSHQRTVRGLPATLTVSERLNGEGVLYRNLNLVFEGREGTVLLVINHPAAEWDERIFDAFIASIQ